uniref:Transcription factor TFIIB cyclin-like domain-containing protein n=1 Tax=viral metagenome TaxID=1070528 RepID=A0A6C0AY94_9ZZZZ
MESLIDEAWNDFNLSLNDSNDTKPISKNCKQCNNIPEQFVISEGDIVCMQCGLVQQSCIISDDPELTFSEEGCTPNVMRCGRVLDPTNPYDTGGNFIPKYMWSWHLDDEGNKRYTNLSKLAIRASYSSKQRAFDEGKYSFEHIQSRLNLNDTVFNAAKLFWGIILKTDILKRGGNRRGMKACCIFYACLSEKQQRNREDIAAAFDIDGSSDFTKGEKIFREIFEKEEKFSWILYKNSENERMYHRYVNQLSLPFSITKTMNQIKEHTRDHLLGIAAKSEIAGLMYFACKEVHNLKHPNKSEIAKCIGICNPTLNKVIEIIKYFYDKNPNLKIELK